MEFKHTPGPWRVGTPGPNGCYTVGTAHGLMTAMIAHSINEPKQAEQAVADARLVAAAPDLLASLQSMIERMKFYADDLEDDDTYQRACQVFAKAAGTAL